MEPINRRLLKENGRIALKRNFWMIMLVVLVGSLLGANWRGMSGGGFSFKFNDYNAKDEKAATEYILETIEQTINEFDERKNFSFEYDYFQSSQKNFEEFYKEVCDYFDITQEQLFQIICIGIGVCLLVSLIVYAFVVCIQFLIGSFLFAPVGVGYRRYFMKNRKGEAVFDDVFSAFSSGKYMAIVKTMFSTNIRIFGWSLLFYFPGLVKAYEYYFVAYIMAENPYISKERARDISRRMTAGHKWQIFVLELSFIGWYLLFILAEVILALISCGILAIPGMVLVLPVTAYVQVTNAELYAERREYALMAGMVSNEELVGF